MDATDPVVVTAIFRPRPGQREAVLAALEPAIAAVHTEPGCILYAIHDAPDGSIVMIEKWESVAHLDEHGGGAAVAQLNRDLDGLTTTATEVARLAPLPMGEPGKGAL